MNTMILTELEQQEIRTAMSFAGWKSHPSKATKAWHFHNVGKVVTLRNQAEFAAKIAKAGTSGPTRKKAA